MLDVCLLGTGGVQPLPGRRLSSVLVRSGRNLALLDCGEGTQVALRERGWGLRRLNAILLSHMHADHVLGLPGLLLTLAFSGKGPDDPLTIYGPEPLPAILRGLLVVAPRLPFPLDVVVLAGGERVPLAGLDGVELGCVPLDHEIPCLAYSLAVSRAPRFAPDRARDLGVPVSAWHRLQHGEEVVIDGRTVTPDQVRGSARRGLRLVYATDTRPTSRLKAFLREGGVETKRMDGTGGLDGADLFICDGTYGDEADKPARWEAQHMTFAEAATLARDGGARRLWLTHFGPALSDPPAYRDRAAMIFPATTVGRDGLTDTLVFDDA